ncbi:MAG: kelch repeat-containing protein [Chloroflexia bacterium]
MRHLRSVAAVLLGLAVLTLLPLAAVGAAPVWEQRASMGTGRVGHTATLLADGQVLVVGGTSAAPSAERYDPVDDRWVASMPGVIRIDHSATLLKDGRVLVAGGRGQEVSGAPTTSTEFYSPATNTWAAGPAMHVARYAHSATLMADGRVFVAGGAPSGRLADITNAAEIFDPATGEWTPAAPMRTPRLGHTATLLGNGRILVAGGTMGTSSNSSLAEVYDPPTNSWYDAGSLIVPRRGHVAVVLNDGQVLVAGGSNDGGPTATAERYDPVRNTFFAVGAMASARLGHTLTVLRDGRVLAAGGRSASAELYDPATGSWSPAPPLATAREGHTATMLLDGAVLVAGGSGGGGERTVERYGEPQVRERCFAETGQCLRGRFLTYWETHGGLAIHGYPISGEFEQVLEDGKRYLVQYTERSRLEYHPENGAPYEVLLGQFGRRVHGGVDAPLPPPSGPMLADRVYLAETGHYIIGSFFNYWYVNGGLAQFGYPITEQFDEVLEDGKTYRVQYFERARMEYHPENTAPYDVLLGQFGRRILAER